MRHLCLAQRPYHAAGKQLLDEQGLVYEYVPAYVGRAKGLERLPCLFWEHIPGEIRSQQRFLECQALDVVLMAASIMEANGSSSPMQHQGHIFQAKRPDELVNIMDMIDKAIVYIRLTGLTQAD